MLHRLTVVLAAFVVAPAVADLSVDGPYAAGIAQVTVSRPNGSTFTATLHYPAISDGTLAPFDGTGGPYPAITFGHGFLQPVTQYASTLRHLATHGVIAIASQSEGGLFPNHGNFALDLRHCLTWLQERNADADHFLFGGVDTARFGAGGHSMGGGASILAAAADPRIVALAPLAGANTSPSSIIAMSNVPIPVRLIAGSQDTIIPLSAGPAPMYANAPGPRQLLVIAGGFHCGFTDASFFGCDSGSITRAEQLAIVRRQLAEFFLLHLADRQDLWRSVWGPEMPPPSETAVTIDPRATVDADPMSLELAPGGVGLIAVTVTNQRLTPDAFIVAIEQIEWPFDLVPATTKMLNPGESETVELAITSTTGADQSALISARSLGDNATRAWTIVELVSEPPTPDLNGDGVVDGADLGILLQSWGPCPACPADLNEDGVVNGADLGILLQNWG